MASGYVRRILDPNKRMALLASVPIRTGDLRRGTLQDKSKMNLTGATLDYLHVPKADRVSYFDLRPNGDPSLFLELHVEDAAVSTQFTSGNHPKNLRPCFYLPYQQNRTTRMKLLAPGTYGGPEVRFFATATIDGCSVYVEADPAGVPKVTHANAQAVSPTKTIDTWDLKRQKIRAKITHMDTQFGFLKKGAATVVERPNYIADKPSHVTQVMQRFANAKGIPVNRVLTYAPFGAVIGVKDGTDWSFYLQKCGSFNYKRTATSPVLGAFFVLEARKFWPDGGGVFRTIP